jgi:hypothetical protein
MFHVWRADVASAHPDLSVKFAIDHRAIRGVLLGDASCHGSDDAADDCARCSPWRPSDSAHGGAR